MNAFQVMMNARKQSIGSNSNGTVTSPSVTPEINGFQSNKRKRKQMLQEWADAKGGRVRKESDEAGERFVKRELEKRATRLKNLLKNEKNSQEEVSDEEIEVIDSDDEDFDPKMQRNGTKNEKKRAKRRRISFHDDDEKDSRKDNFTSKLHSPMKKRDSLLGYFSKMTKNDEISSSSAVSRPNSTEKLIVVSETKSKRGRKPKKRPEIESETSKKVEKRSEIESKKSEQVEKLKKRREIESKTPEKLILIPSLPEKPEILTPDTNGSLRPRRSCTLAPRSYKFDTNDTPPSGEKCKKKTEKMKSDDPSNVIVLSDENSSEITPPAPPLKKLASIFRKKVPLDPLTRKARKAFLQSGLPEAMREEIDRKKELEELFFNEIQYFPSISHVTQLNGDESFKKSPLTIKILPANDEKCHEITKKWNFGSFSDVKSPLPAKSEPSWSHVKDRKAAGRVLKSKFDNFPTYKVFHQLYTKQKESQESRLGEMFSEKYKPSSSDEFLVNSGPVHGLKKWLSAWKDPSNRISLDSDDDFEDESRDSRASVTSIGNAILIYGPCGSGKTSSVMALAAEMHFNVLEINGGAKRTRKKMLQELHEATQSHQLRKENHVKRKNTQENMKKLSLILIEDADVIFEQDDGFISGVAQLVSTSKRPVVISAINPTVTHLLPYLNQNSIEFSPANPTNAAKYLTLMCLAENYIVNDEKIRNLYEKCGNDMRKTILQLQFYLQTGGDLIQNDNKNDEKTSDSELIEVIFVTEDELNEMDDETLKFSTTSITSADDRTVGAPIEHIHGRFVDFFDGKCEEMKVLTDLSDLQEICESSEFISDTLMLRMESQNDQNCSSPDLNREIREFLGVETYMSDSLTLKSET